MQVCLQVLVKVGERETCVYVYAFVVLFCVVQFTTRKRERKTK